MDKTLIRPIRLPTESSRTNTKLFFNNSRRKRALALLFAFIAASQNVRASDPVRDYISRFSPLGGDATIYSSDTLLRLDFDLNRDGQKEVLLSMARDRNAKQGNVWSVYSDTAGETAVGTMTFNSSRFYLGSIDEINRYGLVTFWPGGGGEGILAGYWYDGRIIREVQVASVIRDSAGELQGQTILDKYMNNAVVGDTVVTSIEADALAKEYGIKVDPRTYRQAVEQFYQSQQADATQAPVVNSSPTQLPSVVEAERTLPPLSSPLIVGPDPGNAGRQSRMWLVVPVLMIGLGVAIAIAYFKRRR